VIYDESGWRVKDIVAHVATWDAETLRSFHALRRAAVTASPITSTRTITMLSSPRAHGRADGAHSSRLGSHAQWMKIIFNAMSEGDF